MKGEEYLFLVEHILTDDFEKYKTNMNTFLKWGYRLFLTYEVPLLVYPKLLLPVRFDM